MTVIHSPIRSPVRRPLYSPLVGKWGSAIGISTRSIAEDAAIGTTVGVLSVSGLGSLTVVSYAITADPGNKFDIDGDELITDAELNYLVAASHSVTIEATLSDASTLSQEFVIGVEQVFGPELIVNGDFTLSTGWTAGTGWTITGGKAVYSSGGSSGNCLRAITLAVGQTYRVKFTVSAFVAGNVHPRFQGGTNVDGAAVAADGVHTWDMVAVAGNNTFVARGNTTGNLSIDDVSVRAVL